MNRLSFPHILTALVLIVMAVAATRASSTQDGLLQVRFFDVGQGDALLIETPNGNQVLVDGGPDATILEKLGDTLPFFDRDLDMVIATHPHADHIAGLIKVLERYTVASIVTTDYVYDSPEARAWNTAVRDEGAQVVTASTGIVFDLGTGVTLTVLNPLPDAKPKDPNDSSIAILLEYKEAKMLLVGDMGSAGERRVLALPVTLAADVLKVGHHGSATATSESFLQAVGPQAAVISVAAKNIYHLPSATTLTRLAEDGIPYYTTSDRGTVTVTSDGALLVVSTEK